MSRRRDSDATAIYRPVATKDVRQGLTLGACGAGMGCLLCIAGAFVPWTNNVAWWMSLWSLSMLWGWWVTMAVIFLELYALHGQFTQASHKKLNLWYEVSLVVVGLDLFVGFGSFLIVAEQNHSSLDSKFYWLYTFPGVQLFAAALVIYSVRGVRGFLQQYREGGDRHHEFISLQPRNVNLSAQAPHRPLPPHHPLNHLPEMKFSREQLPT